MKYQLRCNKCGAFESDTSRMDISKLPEEVGATIIVSFFCINCGAEVENHLERFHRDYADWEALCV